MCVAGATLVWRSRTRLSTTASFSCSAGRRPTARSSAAASSSCVSTQVGTSPCVGPGSRCQSHRFRSAVTMAWSTVAQTNAIPARYLHQAILVQTQPSCLQVRQGIACSWVVVWWLFTATEVCSLLAMCGADACARWLQQQRYGHPQRGSDLHPARQGAAILVSSACPGNLHGLVVMMCWCRLTVCWATFGR